MATFFASSLRLFSVTVSSVPRRINSFSVCASLSGGQKWRVSNGMASDGLAYGPLTDLPDWSFADDGQASPETKRRKRRRYKRLHESERIMGFLQEVDDGIKEDDPYKGVAKR